MPAIAATSARYANVAERFGSGTRCEYFIRGRRHNGQLRGGETIRIDSPVAGPRDLRRLLSLQRDQSLPSEGSTVGLRPVEGRAGRGACRARGPARESGKGAWW